jgi:hypothetical protein
VLLDDNRCADQRADANADRCADARAANDDHYYDSDGANHQAKDQGHEQHQQQRQADHRHVQACIDVLQACNVTGIIVVVVVDNDNNHIKGCAIDHSIKDCHQHVAAHAIVKPTVANVVNSVNDNNDRFDICEQRTTRIVARQLDIDNRNVVAAVELANN